MTYTCDDDEISAMRHLDQFIYADAEQDEASQGERKLNRILISMSDRK